MITTINKNYILSLIILTLSLQSPLLIPIQAKQDTNSILYLTALRTGMRKQCDNLYRTQELTTSQAYLNLTNLTDKKVFLHKAFTAKKKQMILRIAIKQLALRATILIPIFILYCIGIAFIVDQAIPCLYDLLNLPRQTPSLIKKLIQTIFLVLFTTIWTAIYLGVLALFKMLNYLTTQLIQYGKVIINPDSLFDFKHHLEHKFIDAIAHNLNPTSQEFVTKKLIAMWEMPEQNKKEIAIIQNFLDQVTPHERKPLTYDIHAFRQKIKHYPTKIRQRAEFIYFFLYTELSYKRNQRKKIIISFMGLPGLGKTRLARVIAHSLGICCADVDLHGDTADLFGGNKGPGRLAEALATAKKDNTKNGFIALICDDADRIMNQKGTNITQFLNFFDPTNFNWPNPYYDNAPIPSPDIIFLVGNFDIKDSALSDRQMETIYFDQPFSPQAKLAIALESIQDKLNSQFSEKKLGITINQQLLIQQIKQVMDDPKNTNMTAREIQNKAMELYIRTIQTKYNQKYVN